MTRRIDVPEAAGTVARVATIDVAVGFITALPEVTDGARHGNRT